MSSRNKFALWVLLIGMCGVLLIPGLVSAQDKYKEAAAKWADTFQPSVLSKADQIKELEWFAEASKSLRGTQISSCSETLLSHRYESEVCAKAFEEITGIKVKHEVTDEDSVVEKVLTAMTTGERIYDAFVNDSDLIGMHIRQGKTLCLSDYAKGEGKDVTDPYFDFNDFLNLDFGTDYDGNLYMMPDEQFANVYWFRYDWFNRPELKAKFKEKYGYDLGVPINWSAYFDIAEFFKEVGTLDGHKVYGSMDFGKKENLLGPRFTDAWLATAGANDMGLPNGIPVDEWGIKVNEQRNPVGASVCRGGNANGPAAVYAMQAYLKSLNEYAPPYAKAVGLIEAQECAARGEVAQSFFQYTGWLSSPMYNGPDSKVVGPDGKPLWRIAPTPHGKYWKPGMKLGYQDAGSWTILTNVTGNNRKAAWLWAQFCTCKSVELAKYKVGGTPVRKSTVNSEYAGSLDEKLGGLTTFFRSDDEKLYTPTGRNVPHYPLLLEIWWHELAAAAAGEKTAQEAMDAIATKMDQRMGQLKQPVMPVKLNPCGSAADWLDKAKHPGAPWAEIKGPYKDGEENPVTMPYEEIIKRWKK